MPRPYGTVPGAGAACFPIVPQAAPAPGSTRSPRRSRNTVRERDAATTGPDAMIIRLFTASGDFQRSMYPAPIMIRFP
ncbi:hypothetical protein GCM10018790_69910 [Kitasatospora xanthocidica]|nr:hypothetical protein GCM10018790_69910 [Kitasatospora xanthocidica]